MAPDTQLAALSVDGYQIPTARLRRRRMTLLMTISLAALFGWLAYRAAQDAGAILGHDHEALLWTALMLVASHQTLLAWFDKPYTVTEAQQAELDTQRVHVSIPLYNESPEIVDRVMYALTLQTRLPYRIVVVDDGTTDYDYDGLRTFWIARFEQLGVLCEWHRQANAGKRHAQAVAFRTAADGFMVTLDSDTALGRETLAEIVKPFADPEVWSVAGLELAYNQAKNLLTRINGMRQLSWQMVQCAALNRFGAILVNRGTCAAYRVELVAETVDAYVSETFMGRPVKYSDDSLLTLYALGRGKAVQQVTAHQYSEYAETLSHALRQWTRWMRGATIRSVWRARYLKLFSYAGVINYLNWWQLVASSAAYIYVGVVLPLIGRPSLSALSAAVGASYLANVRTLLIERDDQDGLSQLDTWLLSPLAWAWSLLVLRPIRVYAILTCTNNGWGTRAKIEVGTLAGHPGSASINPGPTPAVPLTPARAPALAGRLTGPSPDREAPTTVEIPKVKPRPGRHRPPKLRIPLPVIAGVVGTLSVAIVAVGLVNSFNRNVSHQAPVQAGVRAAATPDGGAPVNAPTNTTSTTPGSGDGGSSGTGPVAEPAARVTPLTPSTSPPPSASTTPTAKNAAIAAEPPTTPPTPPSASNSTSASPATSTTATPAPTPTTPSPTATPSQSTSTTGPTPSSSPPGSPSS